MNIFCQILDLNIYPWMCVIIIAIIVYMMVYYVIRNGHEAFVNVTRV